MHLNFRMCDVTPDAAPMTSAMTDVDRQRWGAIDSRDRDADGQFVFAVRSTGIFCRPSCPSRRPRRDHVVFFDTPAEAVRAGFRACLRCRPEDAVVADPWVERVRRLCVWLKRAEGRVTLAAMARRVGGSPWHLQRNFKRIVGVTPRAWLEACRLERAKAGLKHGSSVTAAVVDAGYGASSRFYQHATRRLGMTPAQYRRGGSGLEVTFTITDSPLGRILVAASPQGVCAVAIGEDEAALETGLTNEYPAARITRAEGDVIRPWVSLVEALAAGQQPGAALPLDVRATAFQWQVWRALATIPAGETRTYAEVADAIGRPSAARAVARACATNPVALAIPCHRVVPAAGGTGGYRWGRERKVRLLAAERAALRPADGQ